MSRRRLVGPLAAHEADALRSSPEALETWKRAHVHNHEAWDARIVEHAVGTCIVLNAHHTTPPAPLKHGGREHPEHVGNVKRTTCSAEGCTSASLHSEPTCAKHYGT